MKSSVKEENIDYIINMMKECFIRDKMGVTTPLEWITATLCLFFTYLNLLYKEGKSEDVQEVLDFFYNTLDKFCQDRPGLILIIERFEKGARVEQNNG
jgi:hypothetical protein